MPLTKVSKSLITSVDPSQIDTTDAAAGQVLTYNGSTSTWVASAAPGAGGALSQGTAVTLTNQTNVDFTDIPTTVNRVTVMFGAVSTSGSADVLIKIGAGSIISSGYVSNCSLCETGSNLQSTVTSTAGFLLYSRSGAITRSGIVTLVRVSGNTWVASGTLSCANFSTVISTGGILTLSGLLDRVRVTTSNGTDAFDAGTVNIMWE